MDLVPAPCLVVALPACLLRLLGALLPGPAPSTTAGSGCIDSRCRLRRTNRPAAWQPLSDAQRHVRALVRHREVLLQTQLSQRNRLRDTTDPLVRASLQAVVDTLASQLVAVERAIKEHLAAHSALRTNLQLLTSIVGTGVVTAAKLLAGLGDLAHYESAKAVAADAGLTPRHCESGTAVRRRPQLSKLGKVGLRSALYWPAIRPCDPVRAAKRLPSGWRRAANPRR